MLDHFWQIPSNNLQKLNWLIILIFSFAPLYQNKFHAASAHKMNWKFFRTGLIHKKAHGQFQKTNILVLLSLSSFPHHALLLVQDKKDYQEKGIFHSWGHLAQGCPREGVGTNHLEDLYITLFKLRVCENKYHIFNALKGRRGIAHLVIVVCWCCINLATWWCDSVICCSSELCILLKLYDPLNSKGTN